MVGYSPSAAKTYSFCAKKYYFNWLTQQIEWWKKPHNHPWYRVSSLKRVTHRNMWAGNLYHQIIGDVLQKTRAKQIPDHLSIKQFAEELATAQFTYSQEKKFIGAVKSKAPKLQGVSCFLALFEHMYDLPDKDILSDTLQKIDLWLTNTFAWERWEQLVFHVQEAPMLFIEPFDLGYTLGGAEIFARMDVGLETKDNKFIIYDWKCYSDNIEFVEYNEKTFKHQLLTYALWPVLRERNPIPIDEVTAQVFYPSLNKTLDFTFLEEDLWDYELHVEQWVRFHDQIFTGISDIEFEDLNGPYDPEHSCPWCQFKAICGEEIAWHNLK